MNFTEYMLKMDSLINDNSALAAELRLLNNNLQDMVLKGNADEQAMQLIISEASVIDKKIKENTATINNLAAQSPYDVAYYNKVIESFFKKAEYVSDTISSTLTASTPVTAVVRMKNIGTFFSWDNSKNITLKLQIESGDGSTVYLDKSFTLDTAINPAGDSVTNKDFGVTKTFNITFTTPSQKGQATLWLFIKDTATEFDYKYKRSITIV